MRRMTNGDEPIVTQGGAAVNAPEQAPGDVLGQNQAVAAEIMAQFDTAGPDFDPGEVADEALTDQAEVRTRVARRERERLKEEARLQRAQREEYMRAGVEHRLPRAVGVSAFDQRPDPTLIIDDDGKPAGDPGTVKRLARLVEAGGNDGGFRQSKRRVGELMSFGFKPVVSRVTGRPIVNEFGMLMEAAPEDEGDRKAFHGRRLVNETILKEQSNFRGTLEGINREMGMDAVRPIQTDDHTAGRDRPRRG